MTNPAFVLENIKTVRRIRVFSLLGIPVYVTPYVWVGPVGMFVGGVALAFLTHPDLDIPSRLVQGIIYMLMGQAMLYIHSAGHIISGRIAGSPMDSLLLTATRQVNIYEGAQDKFPPRVHITRALGGPVANILAGLLAFALIALLGPTPTLIFFAVANLFSGLGALTPSPSVDGEVIWRYVGKR